MPTSRRGDERSLLATPAGHEPIHAASGESLAQAQQSSRESTLAQRAVASPERSEPFVGTQSVDGDPPLHRGLAEAIGWRPYEGLVDQACRGRGRSPTTQQRSCSTGSEAMHRYVTRRDRPAERSSRATRSTGGGALDPSPLAGTDVTPEVAASTTATTRPTGTIGGFDLVPPTDGAARPRAPLRAVQRTYGSVRKPS